MRTSRLARCVFLSTALTILLAPGFAAAQNPAGFPACVSGSCSPTGPATCVTDADCVPPGTIFDVCIAANDTCGTTAMCTNGTCDPGGQDCLSDSDCWFCSDSFEPCPSGNAQCSGGGGGNVCSVTRDFCTTDADCRPREAVLDSCIQDVYQFYGGNQDLTCTANDVRISETSVLTIIDACEFIGDFATVQLEADFVLTAEERHDIAAYLGLDGAQALTGNCLVEIIPELSDPASGGFGDPADLDSFCQPNGSCAEDTSVACDNTGDYDYDDCAFIDSCGDMDADAPFDGTVLDVPLSPITFPCVDNNGDGQADLPSCLSWRQPGANEPCTNPLDGHPGAPSKCRCEILDVPLRVPKSLEVVKVVVPADDPASFDLIIDPPGGVIVSGGDGTTTGRYDVSDGFCFVDGDACSKLSDCDDGLTTVEGGDYCDPSDRTVSEESVDLGDFYSEIECVSRIGACSLDSSFTCSLDDSVADPCVNLGLGVCSGTPTPITSCDDCTSIEVPVNNEQTDILCTITNTIIAVDVVKTCDPLSKVGDDVEYDISLSNTSGAGAPDLECSFSDDLLGDLLDPANPYVDISDCPADGILAAGESCTVSLSRTVLESDQDPLPNTASASCTFVDGVDVVASDEDDCETELFQASITFDKTGDAFAKVGDEVDYTITLDNTSSADTPDLVCTITDVMLGIDQQVTLAWNDPDYVLTPTYTVQEGDADPLVNTASVSCSPDGFPNVIEASDDHSVDLFQASISFDKAGDALSKVGDDVDYTITLDNTSSEGTPDLVCTIIDLMLGIDEQVTLAWNDPDHVIQTSYTVQEGDADPLVNTASVSCSPEGFPNVIEASDDHSVDLFQPSISFDKSGDTLSKVGDEVDYAITLDNTSSEGTPDLVCTITDAMLGIDEQVTLAWNDPDHVINTTYTVQEGDADPLVNTASVTCSPEGFPNVLDASDDHSVDLFQPSIRFDKTGDELSKVGDQVDYVITLDNTSSEGTPDLVCTITDAMLGIDEQVTLAWNDPDHVIQTSYTVQEGDADPLVNSASVSCSPLGFPNVLEASDDHSVNLFQASIDLAKTGDALSKVGDDVDYTITLDNTSSAETPDLDCTITDAMLGIDTQVTLASGASHVINTSYTVPEGAADPLVNTASVSCSPAGFPNVLEDSDDHSVDLFQPAVSIVKSGDPYSKVGDDVNYQYDVSNDSSAGTPDLTCSVTDSRLGAIAGPFVLAVGGSDTFFASHTVLEGDPDPLTNTATVSCTVAGFGNAIGDTSNQVSVDLVHPGLSVDKLCTNEPVPLEGPATWDVVFTNTGDVPLDILADDGIGAFSLAAGAQATFPVSIAGPFEGQTEVSNTVNGTWTLPAAYGLPNTGAVSDTQACRVGSRVDLLKLTNGLTTSDMVWNFQLLLGPDGFGGALIGSDSTPPATLDFGQPNLDPLLTYTLCELSVPSGWNVEWSIEGAPVVPYNPNADDLPPEDLGNRCFDFGAGTGYGLVAGDTLSFQINNVPPPEGEARTPGYWKNWSTCSGGNQQYTADNNSEDLDGNGEISGYERIMSGFALIDDVLPITLGSLVVETCEDAVLLLDHRDLDGKKRANDAAYKLARALLAYEANIAAGAATCQEAVDAAAAGHALLTAIGFDGVGAYLRPRDAEYNVAVTLAGTLDAYNNNMLCP